MQLYEFNSTSPIVVNVTSLLSVQGRQAVGAGFASVPSGGNFTIAASLDQILLGGPSNINEGSVVAFTITAKPGASGTYDLGIRGMEAAGSEPMGCGDFGSLLAGSGQPNYAIIGGCITYSTTNANPPFTIPGVSYNILSNDLYFRIVTLTNSTQ